MNKNIYAVGSFVLAFLISGLPVVALAESNSDDGLGVTAQVTAQTRGTNVTTGVSVDLEEDNEAVREQQKQRLEASTTARVQDDDDEEIDLEMEDDDDRAISLSDLKNRIEARKQELEDEEASTTPKFKNAMKNANEVRLAVHALLASRDLLGGGIGQQVSEIAKSMNDSVATTTNAEAKIQTRGFLVRLFFGGDKTMAEVIAEAVAKNQENIQKLTDLLGQASTTAEVKLTLEAQIQALENAQARLQVLAEKEKGAWGLFSWRF